MRTRRGSEQPRAPRSTTWLFLAFSFAVIADPVSSVAYAIEAALRALHGHLEYLLPTMGVVIVVIVLVAINYWHLIKRFPHGGGDPLAVARAFGLGWSVLPIGALVVDFALTIAISIAAAASAVIAVDGALESYRMAIALGLLALVGAITWFGHIGRMLFALMTVVFIVSTVAVVLRGVIDPVSVHNLAPVTSVGHSGLIAVLMAFPVAMALATGIEASSTAVAQLGQLGEAGRRRFGQGSLLMMVGIVGVLTVALAYVAVQLNVGLPSTDSTQIADIARAAAGNGVLFQVFQASSSLLLLAAASSSFQAGPGLLKALSGPPGKHGVLPDFFGWTNSHHTPYLAAAAYLVVAGLVVVGAGAREQELVLFYAVAVFLSFLMGLLAMARFAWRDRQLALLAVNSLAIIGVTFTIGVNLARVYPIVSLVALGLVAAVLYVLWARAGKPEDIENIEAAG
ncbi:MAG: amino acid permease [Gammaproteobacteria bacterium]